jgi:hypothetical protein
MLFRQYPHNWRKASSVLKRVTGYTCELCGKPVHSVHHKGVPFATGDGWRPGRRGDKHDLRRENLISLCFSCHDFLDNGALTFYARLRARGQQKRARHKALGVGTGLVPLRPVFVSWSVLAILYAGLLKWSKRTGRTRYQLLSGPSLRIVDSYLVKEISYESARG